MYNKILVPVDFAHSEQTVNIIEKASFLAGQDGKVVLLHIVEEVPVYIQSYLPDKFRTNKVEDAKNELNSLLSKANIDNSRVQIEVRKGNSYVSIIESSKDNKADLIIINSHKPGLEDYLLGSTAAKVVRHAKCAVLVER